MNLAISCRPEPLNRNPLCMLRLLVPSQTAVIILFTLTGALGSKIFAPNFWLSVVHFLRSLSFVPAHTKMRLFTTTPPPTTTSTTMTSRSSAAATAALLKASVKRIIKESTCTTLGITKESIKCTGCKNAAQRCLRARVRSASIDSREYRCRQPWVLKRKTDHLIQIYENTWKELVDELGYPKSKLHDESETSRKMPPISNITKCKKRQKLTMLPSDQDVEAYNLSCSSPSFVESSLAAPPALSQPPPVKEISTTNTPSALSALSVDSDHSPFDAHTMLNILAQNSRLLEDVIAGLSSHNQVLSLKLQIACATNSRLVSDEEVEQEHDEGEEQEQEEEQEEEQGQQEEAGAPISKWDIVTNRSHHLKYKNGNDQFKKILNQATGRGNYYGKPLGKKLYAHAAALSPQKFFKNLEMILALNQAAFLVDSGIGISSIDL
jgi:hypothetical protein